MFLMWQIVALHVKILPARKDAASHYEFSYAQLDAVQFADNLKPVEILDDGLFSDKLKNMTMVVLKKCRGVTSSISLILSLLPLAKGRETR